MERLAYWKAIVPSICFMLCQLACATGGSVTEKHPDEALFQRAMDAIETKHFTAAHLTLETLIKTYPDSEYSDRARIALQDRRIANCADNFTTSADCVVLEPVWPR